MAKTMYHSRKIQKLCVIIEVLAHPNMPCLHQQLNKCLNLQISLLLNILLSDFIPTHYNPRATCLASHSKNKKKEELEPQQQQQQIL